MHRYVIALPYRRRSNSLRIVRERLPAFLRNQSCIADFLLLLIEQEDGKPFNFAKLGNVGYTIGKSHFGSTIADRFINHPVDGIPLSGDYTIPDDSSVMMCEAGDPSKLGYHNSYYAKAHAFHAAVFEKINGYSNEYWGWGYDDDDLFARLRSQQVLIWGTYIEYEFFMAHHLKPSAKNLDIQDGVSRYDENYQIFSQTQQNPDIWKSGLSNLSYKILEQENLSPEDNFFRFKVSI